ncbi:MAG: hypothetical protein ABID09_07695 [Candidatus Omnitrophota bacterium]
MAKKIVSLFVLGIYLIVSPFFAEAKIEKEKATDLKEPVLNKLFNISREPSEDVKKEKETKTKSEESGKKAAKEPTLNRFFNISPSKSSDKKVEIEKKALDRAKEPEPDKSLFVKERKPAPVKEIEIKEKKTAAPKTKKRDVVTPKGLTLNKLLSKISKSSSTTLERLNTIEEYKGQVVKGAGKVKDILKRNGSEKEALVYIRRPFGGIEYEVIVAVDRESTKEIKKGITVAFEAKFTGLTFETLRFEDGKISRKRILPF